ncbi:Phosphate/phosphoenolpyruvate translocator protein [Pelomyxa schiedti]|nr:Phosphate/phosphoenolpyruvate translocator protein [Pelomyxa schiedti]
MLFLGGGTTGGGTGGRPIMMVESTFVGLEIWQYAGTWLVLWFVLNVAVTLTNKGLFQLSGFHFPTTVSLVHMLFTSIGSSLVMRNFHVPRCPLKTKGEYLAIFLMSVLFCSNILTGNIGLRYVPVSLVQCVRSTIPGITMFLSVVFLAKQYSWKHYLSVLLVMVGVATATYTTIEFHAVGFAFVVTVCLLSSLKSVMTNKLLVQKGLRLHPFDLLQHMSTLSFIQLTLLWIITGEPWKVYNWWTLQESSSGEHTGLRLITVLVVNGICAFFLNVANFFFTKHTSALTVTICGNVKHVVTILLSIAMFHNAVPPLNALGIAVTTLGAALYSALEYRESQEKKNAPKPSQV